MKKLILSITIILSFNSINSFGHVDHYANFNEANEFLIGGVRSGELKYKEMIVDGLEKAPEYFKRLFTGSNFGKLIVKVADQ